jgi:hypothetical protein
VPSVSISLSAVEPATAPTPSASAAVATIASPASLDLTSPHPYDAPDASAPGAALGSEEITAWGRARVANAKAKVPELVRLPLHMHGPGWGCSCPLFYVGTMDLADDGFIWVDPDYDPTAAAVSARETRIAEGYFTGESHVEKGDGPVTYDVVGFEVLRTRPPTPTDAGEGIVDPGEASVVVLARGDQARLETPAPADGRAFLLVAASIPLGGRGAFQAARARADGLRARFPNVEVLDSRTVPGLFCCNYVVVLDRAKTEHEATVADANARKAGVLATVRRGW